MPSYEIADSQQHYHNHYQKIYIIIYLILHSKFQATFTLLTSLLWIGIKKEVQRKIEIEV